MFYQFIKYSIQNGVAFVTLNRPEVLNSVNKPIAKELQIALQSAREDKKVRAILLTGSGKAFCAGQDLAEAAPKDEPLADIGEIVRESYNPIILLIREIEKPVICVVNGMAAGAGANIALSCDIIIASSKASFLQAFAKIGLIPDSGGTFILPRLVGFQRASAMMMLAEKISAEDALRFGMIYKIFPDEELMHEAVKIADYLSTQPTKGLWLTKQALNKSMTNDLRSQLLLEEQLQIEAGATHDYQEGVIAFLEKRVPKFIGK